jgi:hypothetical protein
LQISKNNGLSQDQPPEILATIEAQKKEFLKRLPSLPKSQDLLKSAPTRQRLPWSNRFDGENDG